MTNFEKVGLFMSTFGQEVKKKSELSNDKINSLRLSLIQEELDELTKAINENDTPRRCSFNKLVSPS